VRLVHTEAGRADETLVFRGFTCESGGNKGNFRDHSLPLLALPFTRSQDFEHFILCYGANLGERDLPFSSFFLAFLLDGVAKYLGAFNL